MESSSTAEAESSRTSRRLSGIEPEFPAMEKQPSLNPSRTASRAAVRIQSPSQQLETESQRGDPSSDEDSVGETPRQPLRTTTPQVVINQPTPMKPRIGEGSSFLDLAASKIEESVTQELMEAAEAFQDATRHLQRFYSKHKPSEPEFEDSPIGFHKLVNAVDDLLSQPSPQKPPGAYPRTPEKPKAPTPTPVLIGAPQKGKGPANAPGRSTGWMEDLMPRIPPFPSLPKLFGTERPPTPRSQFAEPGFSHISPSANPTSGIFSRQTYQAQPGPSSNPVHSRPTPGTQYQQRTPYAPPETPQQSQQTPGKV